jgi:hypothetical protein
MTDKNGAGNREETGTATGPEAEEPAAVYQKPILRKYDQIEQVKPYGPSELEAG